MTEPLNGSIEQDSTDSVLHQLRGIKRAVSRLPVAPTEVFEFELDPASSGLLTLKQATHVKVNVQQVIITGAPILIATGVTYTLHLGARTFPFHMSLSDTKPIPMPIKWDRGVDAWFSCDTQQTEMHCYIIGSIDDAAQRDTA